MTEDSAPAGVVHPALRRGRAIRQVTVTDHAQVRAALNGGGAQSRVHASVAYRLKLS
ncbi:MAG: hypothetical protein WAO09_02680 [Candidatus Dormiibacterota bacterium]